MPKTRKSHPPSLKAKVAIEAIKAQRTTAQISQMFSVHPSQVAVWKKQALSGLPDVFRQPQNGGRVRSGPPSCPAVDADFGDRGSLPQTALELSGAGSPSVSVPAARCRHRKTQPRLEHRYYLHSDAWWLSVPGRGD